MQVLSRPLEAIVVGDDTSKKVLRFSPDEAHTASFGYEWTRYSRTYSDKAVGIPVSKVRLEATLGFPLEFLKDKNVLELGCGAGRFTVPLADHAKHVIAVDLSRAVYVNEALGRPNVTVVQADLLEVPELSEPVDIVYCRGVIQHTKDPHESLKRLFDYCPARGLVIFDVYKKYRWDALSFKYFWRPFFKRFVPLESFDRFINRRGNLLYRLHHGWLRFVAAIPVFRTVIGKTPLYLGQNWDKRHRNLPHAQRVEIFKNELVDMLYAHYDRPMTTEEVIHTLARIGQIPYSYDSVRNYFRYQKSADTSPMEVFISKEGVFKRHA